MSNGNMLHTCLSPPVMFPDDPAANTKSFAVCLLSSRLYALCLFCVIYRIAHLAYKTGK